LQVTAVPREGITLAWHGSDMDRYTGKLARLP
jgi:hypothetical protein